MEGKITNDSSTDKAQEAYDDLQRVECDVTALEWFEKYANVKGCVVETALSLLSVMVKQGDELKPCPFCNSDQYDPVCDVEEGGWWVGCVAHQEGGCGLHLEHFKTRDYAIKAWNTRTTPTDDIVKRFMEEG